mgnify:CR=1 FL=1
MAYLSNGNKAECCGCGACLQICPKQCISMQPDEKGFLYPKIEESLCIHCDLCRKVCPEDPAVRPKGEGEPELYGAVHKDEKVLMESASGGAFPAIVDAFCDKNYVSFGVEYDKDMKVCHNYVTDKAQIGKFKKSKYVQSDTKETFRKAREFLEQGKKVLYTGTPCQISGLKAYLRKDYENLLTVDLICHGVASPELFADYITLMEEKFGQKVVWADMRGKEKRYGNWSLINSSVKVQNQAVHTNNISKAFVGTYLKTIGYRDACFSCSFYPVPRASDITIGDLWGAETIMPELFDGRGISLILLNSDKGKSLLPEVQKRMKTKPVSLEEATKKNPNLSRPTIRKEGEDAFWEMRKNLPVGQVLEHFGLPPRSARIKQGIRGAVSMIVPKKVRKFIKQKLFHR